MIHCANCIHCKVFKQTSDNGGLAVTRVRCVRERWRFSARATQRSAAPQSSSGSPRTYLYHTVDRRTVESCADYECAGDVEDTKEFIPELRRSLPDCSYDELDVEEVSACDAMQT